MLLLPATGQPEPRGPLDRWLEHLRRVLHAEPPPHVQDQLFTKWMLQIALAGFREQWIARRIAGEHRLDEQRLLAEMKTVVDRVKLAARGAHEPGAGEVQLRFDGIGPPLPALPPLTAPRSPRADDAPLGPRWRGTPAPPHRVVPRYDYGP